jgi:hypothetical protein
VNSHPLFELMASFNNQAGAASATKLVLPITGGSCSEPANKKQKKEAHRRVQHVGVKGPFIKSRWSHISITFSQEDLQLKDYPHNDAMEYPYNAIIGRGTLNAFEAILHLAYLCMKIPSDQGPIAIHGSQEVARKAKGNWTDSKAIHNIDGAEACEQYKYRREMAASADQPKPMLLCEDIAEQKVLLGSQLSEEQEKNLTRFLFNNKDVFAWSANDLCGVNRDVIEHSLNVDPSFRPRKQRLQKMSDDKAEGARNEVKRLLSAGVIREVKYPEWLANTVMVKKANGKWRMCIDFTDLNKACPKDEFPLPRIDSLVDAAASSELISLLDCYSGYHQI